MVLEDLRSGSALIHDRLYKSYSDNLRKAVGGVLDGDDGESRHFNLGQKMKGNTDRFAAYKAYHATQQIQKQRTDEKGNVRSEKAYMKHAKAVFDAFNRYQVAEYNTAVARSRTARQWMEYTSEPVKNELYPNMKWLPSRSAHRREAHEKFYGLVFPKNHPFWKQNQPGNLWQCKCDWEETDEPAFSGAVPTGESSRGLEGNPGETGMVFTEEASYFRVTQKEREKIEGFLKMIDGEAMKKNGIIPAAYRNITEKVVETEDSIRTNKKFETAVVFDEKGNIVIDRRGEATSVAFTDKEISAMENTVITHNHPRGWRAKSGTLGRIGNSFSFDDVSLAISGNAAEVRAVTPMYTFSMKRPKDGWGIDALKLYKDYANTEIEMQARMKAMIRKKTTQQDINQAIDRAESMHFHLIWKELSKKYGFEYAKAKSIR